MYKKKLGFFVSLFFIFLDRMPAQHSFPQYRIHLESVSYKYSPFPVNIELSTLYNENYQIQHAKIPEGLSDLCLLSLHLQPSQNRYYLYKIGLLKDSFLTSKFKNSDSYDFAGVYLHESINILTGKNDLGKKVIIIDSDNNNDFTNDKVFNESFFKIKEPKFIRVSNIQFYDKVIRQIDKATIYVLPNLKEPRLYTVSSPELNRCYMEVKMRNDFKEGTFVLEKGVLLSFKINNSDMINKSFSPENTEIYPYVDGKLHLKKGFNNSYLIGDTVHVDNHFGYIHFLKITPSGDSLYFEYLKLKQAAVGYQKNFQAMPINGINIANSEYFFK